MLIVVVKRWDCHHFWGTMKDTANTNGREERPRSSEDLFRL